ncbi:hypothetical protein [Streptomyces kronopolitis]
MKQVQRKSLLPGVLPFEDTSELLIDGQITAPHRPVIASVGESG